MHAGFVAMTLLASSTFGQLMHSTDVDKQNKAFKQLWETEFEWKVDALPAKAKVEEARTPYSGYIYPDTQGGTITALRKYDQAFQQAGRAVAHEKTDIAITLPVTRRVTYTQRFGFRTRTVSRLQTVNVVPHWHGHCNGWTSATIRHAEPETSVQRNGVTFSPSDIKALLAELYIYNENEMLASGWVHPAILHTVLGNWIGRGGHPIGMEADPGSEKWNYPIYGYRTQLYNRSQYHVDVQMWVTFALNSETETDKSPRVSREKYFNYHLNLDEDGKIVGGYYYLGSSQIEMLWVPLSPRTPGKKGHEKGNPHIAADKILAIWRDSVPPAKRNKWAIVDPAREDRLAQSVVLKHLKPAQEGTQPTLTAATANGDDSSMENVAADTSGGEE